jgi:hypothetical protein
MQLYMLVPNAYDFKMYITNEKVPDPAYKTEITAVGSRRTD